MSILPKLASALQRRDEVPNQELAKLIADKRDTKAITELVHHLHNKDKNISNDCIKVLYEIGAIHPDLIAGYADVFVELLTNKNNRLVWGAMAALHTITVQNPEVIYHALPQILEVAEKGSVITKDQAISILIKLMAIRKYTAHSFVLLADQLKHCPTNQLPMYAEQAYPVIPQENKKLFITILAARLDEIDKETKRKRVEKVIRKLQ
ncbi:hypothetical protein [Chitinophaga defluvii]|uniref:HEAT repeat protein n=1 Tax=Chitinophaga defluvii TaxID=3163343 RepID=A0ABV2T3J1_9BACT